LERAILISLSFVGFYFCYDFGHLLTGEFGLGQMVGIPFAIVLTILSVSTILTKNKSKKIFRVLTISYTLSLLLFVLQMVLIKTNVVAGDIYLYYPEWKAYDILLFSLGTGVLISIIVISRDFMNGK